jgi:nucleoside-diphosphate-sugar epimerase
LGNLKPTRDFNYVADTVEGFIRIAENPSVIGQVTNIGTGREISIGGLTNIILNLIGKNYAPITCDDERTRPEYSEVERLCASTHKANEILNWHPQYSLEEGLTQTIEWIRSNLERYRLGTYAI